MKLIKTAIVGLVLAVVVGGAGVIASPSPKPAEAAPTAMTGLNSSICTALAVAFGGLSATDAALDCLTIQTQNGVTSSMQHLISCLRGADPDHNGTHDCLTQVSEADPRHVTPDDFKPLDLDKNQIHVGQDLLVFAFVNDDSPVRFTTDTGVLIGSDGVVHGSGHDWFCETGTAPSGGDPDCDGDTATAGDGVVVARLRLTGDEDPLTIGHVTAIQEGIGFPMDFTVVGKPVTITLTPLFGKDTLQTGATIAKSGLPPPPPLPTDCTFGASAAAVLGANNDAEKAVVVAKALDNDGNEVVGALLNWDHPLKPSTSFEPLPQGGVALQQTPTIDTGPLGVGFPQFVCGGSETGDLKLRVTFDKVLDTFADPLTHADITLHVVGPPANVALVADPPVVDCNGTNTSKITATVTTADGKPVANGVDVNFNVQVLGTVNPLTANSGAGTASTTVTPLSAANDVTTGTRGLPVIVTAGDIASSILVKCSDAAAAPPPPPPPGAPGGGAGAGSSGGGGTGTIRPPDTGTGGAAGAGSLSWWPMLALAAGATALIGARFALNRAR